MPLAQTWASSFLSFLLELQETAGDDHSYLQRHSGIYQGAGGDYCKIHILKAHAFNIVVVLFPVFHLVKFIRELPSGGI